MLEDTLVVGVALLETEALAEGEALALALAEGDALALALALALADALALALALALADALALALAEGDALALALGEDEALALAEGDALALADGDALALADALVLGDALVDGEALVLGVALLLADVLAVGLEDAVLHSGRVMVLSCSVTAPLRASSLPVILAPVVALMDVRAMMVPLNVEFVPRVAELPTCQNTLQACAPLIKATVLSEAVVSVEAISKMNTAFESPWASSVTVPVRLRLEVDL